jgi:peptidyl-tRNA hydrolase
MTHLLTKCRFYLKIITFSLLPYDDENRHNYGVWISEASRQIYHNARISFMSLPLYKINTRMFTSGRLNVIIVKSLHFCNTIGQLDLNK